MIDPTDIKALDEYLKGGSDISQRYRELGSADVPPELDRHVLEEARAAVAGSSTRSRSWMRWSAPVALAASVVLVVAVVIRSPVQDQTIAIQPASEVSDRHSDAEESKRERETVHAQQQAEPELQAVVPEQPAAAPAAPPPSVAKAEKKRMDYSEVEEVLSSAPVAREQSSAPVPAGVETATAVQSVARNELERAADVAADSAVKADDASQLQEVAVTGSRQRRTQGRTAGPRNTISGSAFGAENRPAADAEAEAEQRDPAEWLEEIRELRRAGKAAEADRAWEQFFKAFPDFPVADDDLARKRQ